MNIQLDLKELSEFVKNINNTNQENTSPNIEENVPENAVAELKIILYDNSTVDCLPTVYRMDETAIEALSDLCVSAADGTIFKYIDESLRLWGHDSPEKEAFYLDSTNMAVLKVQAAIAHEQDEEVISPLNTFKGEVNNE